MTPASTPDHFGPYEVFDRLGLGGMAIVHHAKKRGPEGFEQNVALKRMLSHLADDPSFVESFIREAKVASLLVHPNIAQIYDFGRIGGIYYIAMELVAGFDVRKLLRYANRSNEAIPLAVVLSILGELCDALDHAHTFVDEHGTPLDIIHRDVSPSNMIVAQTGHLKVIDFGIAKASSRQLHTESGKIKGKLGYMSPEVALGLPVGPVSDIFSAGVVAWELVTASPLFSSRTDFETMRRIREGAIVPPSHHNPSCPRELDEIILAALEREPLHRLASAAAFRHALDSVTARAGIQVSARGVAEWMFKFAHADDSWARVSRSRSRTPSQAPSTAAALRLPLAAPATPDVTANMRRPATQPPPTPSAPRLLRSSEHIQLATEIWGDDAMPTVGSPGPDFSVGRMSSPLPTQAPPPGLMPEPPRVVARARRSKAPFVILGVLVLIAAALGGYLLWPPSATPPSSLRFVIRPADSTIEIGGKQVGRGADFKTVLAPGVYSVSIHHDGYKRWTNSITVRDGDQQTIEVALDPAIARVTIDSKPPGLPIELDGKPSGHTTPATIETVAGVHQITVTDASGEVWSKELTAIADTTHSFEATFPATPVAAAVTAPTSTPKVGRTTNRTPARPRVAVKEPVKLPEPEPEPPVVVEPPKPDPPVPTPVPVVPEKPAKPLRTPVVAASAVTKLAGELPTLKTRSGDSNGDVLAKMCIDAQGRVSSVKIVKSTAEIAGDLQRALQTWRYKPYVRNGEPVPVCFPLSLRVVVKRS